MDNIKRKWCCVPSDNLAGARVVPKVPAEDRTIELLADIEETLAKMKKYGDCKRVPMSEEVQNYASDLQIKVMLGAQILKEVLNALGTMHWVCTGLTIIAIGLDMTLKMHDNKEKCINIMKDSLDIWKKIMMPILEKKEVASDYMEESMDIIFGGYLLCKNILNSSKFKRFICVRDHEKELEMWKEKRSSFLQMTSAIITLDISKKLSVTPSTIKTSTTIEVGLEQRKRDVMKLLKPEDKEEIRIVVLYGMGGVGKSTLADAVYRQISVSRERHCCGIKMDENPTKDHITELQKQVVESLTNQRERNPMVIKDKLRQVLLSETGDPVLIYIDNVLQQLDLEEFLSLDSERIKLPKGSRWLVTTRDEAVCTKIFDRNKGFIVEKFNVKLLNNGDAQKLLCLHAFGQEEPSSDVMIKYNYEQGNLIREMASSICGNLPLALRVLGRSLSKMNAHEWKNKYDELIKYGNAELYKRVSNVLQSSYNTLDGETQTAFLMICVCLYNCSYRTVYDVVESILPEASTFRLIEMSLLERQIVYTIGNRSTIFIKVHDLVRNFGYQMAIARKCAPTKMLTCKQDLLDYDESWSHIKWLRVPPLEDGIEAELLEKFKEVEMIVLDTHVNGEIKIPPKKLKVIITSSSLPFELDKLKEVVYLELGEDIKVFPVAPSTKRLQVLRGFSAASIPKEAINLHKTTLRKLWCGRIGELSSYFCVQMTELQVLIMSSFEGKRLPVEMGSLVNLEALRIESNTIQEFPRTLGHVKRLQFLFLRLDNVEEIPSGVLGELKEIVHLQLVLGRVLTPVPMQDFGQLTSLEVLNLNLSSINRLTNDGVSLKLEKLKVFSLRCNSLTSLGGDVQLSCPLLQWLRLGLGELKVLPSTFITGSTKLQNLTLFDCRCLQELSLQTEILRALQSLTVARCPSLKAIPELGSMESLNSLALVICPALRKLPSDLDEQKARSMQFLACDKQHLPPQFFPLPTVLAFSINDERAIQQVESYCADTMPTSIFAARNACLF